ncbi:MAG: NlpC/P60 family protein [Marinilabiliaceae bacterium]
MKHNFPIFLIAGILLLWGCTDVERVESLIDDFRDAHIEDTREEVFEISFYHKQGKKIVLKGEMEDSVLKRKLVGQLEKAGFSVLDSIEMLPRDVPAPWGLVRLSVANLRASPSFRAELVTQAVMGTPVRVLKEKGGWVYIQTPDRYLSWCGKSALSFKSDEEIEEWRQHDRVMFTSPFGFMTDTLSDQNVCDLVSGSVLEVEKGAGEELFAKTPDGRTGRIKRSDVVPFGPDHVASEVDTSLIEEEARRLMGVPYLWGGTSAKGMDCSGFTKTVYRMNGLLLARDASLQVRHGEEVPVDSGWSGFEKGDLLFFVPRRGSERISHVGIYLSGGEYIHAAGRVKVNSLDSTSTKYNRHRDETLSEVRRIRGNEGVPGITPLVEHPWY